MPHLVTHNANAFGSRLKYWRKQAGLSQLQFACKAEVSPRHLSFLETGRSRPNAAIVLQLSECLQLPLREQNELLRLAGLAPAFPDQDFSQTELEPYRHAIQRMLQKHNPFPAWSLNRWGDVIEANETAQRLFPALRQAGVNLYQSFMQNNEWKRVIENWEEVAQAAFQHLLKDAARYPHDRKLSDMIEAMYALLGSSKPAESAPQGPGILTQLNVNGQTLEMTTLVAQFGPVTDVFLSELKVELMYPVSVEGERVLKAWQTAVVSD
ncbi:MAG: helix-turn-helix transcriptional regulator [Hahellaceae bacterium]|nr:helix-turn-helix transcriptional regulator [Hahellaceae bacterium]MCP5168179.1 helix-turn-helix transcriptional regulator [Hahellaceae bacterium]